MIKCDERQRKCEYVNAAHGDEVSALSRSEVSGFSFFPVVKIGDVD